MSIQSDDVEDVVECNKCSSVDVDRVKFSDKRNEGFGTLYECNECKNRFREF